ncbi:hypothetical protein HOW80_004788, partial [Escherichia coli]|nr:hypothetical protein [Escherichia coli]EIG0481252.1 hypothetical protein [Escherichia coli]HEB5728616.1 hypothetical protein [Escherichia coli]
MSRLSSLNKLSGCLFYAILLCPNFSYAEIITKDTLVNFNEEKNYISDVFDVENDATLNFDTTLDTTRFGDSQLIIDSGGGINIVNGTVHLSRNLKPLINGTGYINVSGPNSILYSDGYWRLGKIGIDKKGGRLSITNGGTFQAPEIHENVDSLNVSGSNSQIITKRFLMGCDRSDSCNDLTVYVDDYGEINATNEVGAGFAWQKSKTFLVASNGGKVSTDTITISTNGNLVLGTKEGEPLQKAGTIEANKIEFVFDYDNKADKKITLNHTSTDAEINAAIRSKVSGLGTIDVLNGTTLLSGNNSDFSGKTNIYHNGVLKIKKNLGLSDIYNDGALYLIPEEDMQFDNMISGSGYVVISNNVPDIHGMHSTHIGGNNAAFSGEFTIEQLASVIVNTPKNLGNATIANNGWLDIDTQSDWDFSNTMTGDGGL